MLSQYLCSFHLQNDVERKELYKKKIYFRDYSTHLFYLLQVAPPCGQICKQKKWHHLDSVTVSLFVYSAKRKTLIEYHVVAQIWILMEVGQICYQLDNLS